MSCQCQYQFLTPLPVGWLPISPSVHVCLELHPSLLSPRVVWWMEVSGERMEVRRHRCLPSPSPSGCAVGVASSCFSSWVCRLAWSPPVPRRSGCRRTHQCRPGSRQRSQAERGAVVCCPPPSQLATAFPRLPRSAQTPERILTQV